MPSMLLFSNNILNNNPNNNLFRDREAIFQNKK